VIEVLVSTYKFKGTYNLTWRPENLSAGIYIIQLQSGNKSNLEKVIYTCICYHEQLTLIK